LAAFQVASPDLVACRAYLDATFDVDRVLTSIAIQNFGQAWDDNFHNWFSVPAQHRRQVVDVSVGSGSHVRRGAGLGDDKSIYIGDGNDADTRNKPYNNRIKHTFITCHKAALHQKYLLLLNTVLKNSTTAGVMDVVSGPKAFNRSEATLQHGSFAQDTHLVRDEHAQVLWRAPRPGAGKLAGSVDRRANGADARRLLLQHAQVDESATRRISTCRCRADRGAS
jgi:hypothetical protein